MLIDLGQVDFILVMRVHYELNDKLDTFELFPFMAKSRGV
jgi:hypothetical protein